MEILYPQPTSYLRGQWVLLFSLGIQQEESLEIFRNTSLTQHLIFDTGSGLLFRTADPKSEVIGPARVRAITWVSAPRGDGQLWLALFLPFFFLMFDSEWCLWDSRWTLQFCFYTPNWLGIEQLNMIGVLRVEELLWVRTGEMGPGAEGGVPPAILLYGLIFLNTQGK